MKMASPRKCFLLVANDGTQYEILFKADDEIENSDQQAESNSLLEEVQAEAPSITDDDVSLFNEHSYTTRPKNENTMDQSSDLAMDEQIEHETSELENTGNDVDNDDNDVQFFLWTHSAILALLDTYRNFADDFNEGRSRKRNIWSKIAKIMINKGFNVTPDICDQKWRNLLLTFRKIVRRRELNPEKRSSWVYFDIIKDIMSLPPKENKPDNSMIMPGNIKFRAIRKKPELGISTLGINSFSESTTPYKTNSFVPAGKPVQNQSYTAPHWFLIFAEEQQKQHQQQMQTIKQMHDDIVKLEKEKNSLLKDLLNTIQKSFTVP